MWQALSKVFSWALFRSVVKRGRLHAGAGVPASPGSAKSNKAYWSQHTVTNGLVFASREHSLEYLHWRGSQYLFYEELMPFQGHDGDVILDYGCGPGNDLVGFVEYSKPRLLIGLDISLPALAAAKQRLALHGNGSAKLIQIQEEAVHLPLKDRSVDFIHSSGVLHHISNIEGLLGEFHRVLTPEGRIRVMVYNYESIWLHLYVAYHRRIVNAGAVKESLAEAFKKSTDGEECPFSVCYTPSEFLNLVGRFGFKGIHVGSAVSLHELSLLGHRYEAMMNPQLDRQHREFLQGLTFDQYGRPLHRGEVAGIDAVYELAKEPPR